eukprot:9468100-Prorocentrum_lima.AAC.1
MPGIVLIGGLVIHPAQKIPKLSNDRALSWAINTAYEHQKRWEDEPEYRLTHSRLGCTRNNHRRYSTLPWEAIRSDS